MCGGSWVARGHSGGLGRGAVLATREVGSLVRDFNSIQRPLGFGPQGSRTSSFPAS